MQMHVQIRNLSDRRPRRQVHPLGLGRLLLMVTTIACLSLDFPIIFWFGIALLGLILPAISRPANGWLRMSSMIVATLSLSLWHLHIFALWVLLLFLAISVTQFIGSI